MDVSDTRKLDQTKGARQIWSCSMEYSLNNAVYVIMRIAGADYDGPKREIGFVGFFVTVFGFGFFPKPPHHSVKLDFDWSKIKRSTEKTPLESRHYPSNLNFARAVNRAPKFIWARGRYRAPPVECPVKSILYVVKTSKRVSFCIIMKAHVRATFLHLHTSINRTNYLSWCMLYIHE